MTRQQIKTVTTREGCIIIIITCILQCKLFFLLINIKRMQCHAPKKREKIPSFINFPLFAPFLNYVQMRCGNLENYHQNSSQTLTVSVHQHHQDIEYFMNSCRLFTLTQLNKFALEIQPRYIRQECCVKCSSECDQNF